MATNFKCLRAFEYVISSKNVANSSTSSSPSPLITKSALKFGLLYAASKRPYVSKGHAWLWSSYVCVCAHIAAAAEKAARKGEKNTKKKIELKNRIFDSLCAAQ